MRLFKEIATCIVVPQQDTIRSHQEQDANGVIANVFLRVRSVDKGQIYSRTDATEVESCRVAPVTLDLLFLRSVLEYQLAAFANNLGVCVRTRLRVGPD